MYHLDRLATELLLHIFRSCDSISDILNLAATCKRIHRLLHTMPDKVQVLGDCAENEFGPIEDIVQLVTHNESQAVHVVRTAPVSMTLLGQIVRIGRVARRWERIYPIKKWKVDYENRRSLTREEHFRLRRAVYRLWLYHRAFHVGYFDRFTRHHWSVIRRRAQLLHNWSTDELAEIEDLRSVMCDVVQNHVCPSNGAIARKFRKRYPNNNQLTFNIHLGYRYRNDVSHHSSSALPPPGLPAQDASTPNTVERYFHTAHPTTNTTTMGSASRDPAKYWSRFRNDFFHDPGNEGWGDEVLHYYVVQDMMKLDPCQILWLCDHAPLKQQVEDYVYSIGGDAFRDNGETFFDTLIGVMKERGDEIADLKAAIDDQVLGIARTVDV